MRTNGARSTSVWLAVVLLLAASLAAQETSPDAATASAEASGQLDETIAEVLGDMDRSVDPCTDFYRYACGSWLDTTELPSDKTTWARSFSVVYERNREIINEILTSAAGEPGDDPDRQRIGAYYASCMDEEAIEKSGAKPLEPIFAEIARVEDPNTLLEVTGKLHRRGIGALFGGQVLPDFKNPELNIVFFVQGGLGMPDRDYYVSEEENKKELMRKYELHVARMFGLLGEDEETAAEHAAQVVAFETELAEASRPAVEMRNLDKLYNKIDIAGLKELTPGLPWDSYLAATGYPHIKDINVATPEFFEALEKVAAGKPAEVLRTYLRWHAVDSTANRLPKAFVDANFDFFYATLSGQKQIEPRWKRCVQATQGALGEAIGKVYVAQEFPGDSKQIALEMIHDIEAAFAANLPDLAWMDDATRGRAMEKVKALGNKIGYPDEWRDYSSMQVSRESYFDNALAAIAFEFDRQARKIGQPVDRKEWAFPPQTVNAFYHPLMNEVVFPAGILQPPFFHRDFPAPMNYGAIGAAVGHELTHGFDDQGRKFDPKGRLAEWWEPEVAESFEQQAACIRDLYSTYEIEEGVAVQGDLTLGENIADIGGVKQTYRAYKLWEKRQEDIPRFSNELTNDQLFFVAFGQTWCALMTPEQLRLQVTTDPHSPPRFRVIGTVSNNPAFFEAFGCEEGSAMRSENVCTVW